jgi:hypothetical protein
VRPALDDLGCPDQRYRRQSEHPVAPSRSESAHGDQAGEPRQTLCPLARQRAHLGGSVLFTVCGAVIGAFGRGDPCVGDGWQCRGLWLRGADDPRAV